VTSGPDRPAVRSRLEVERASVVRRLSALRSDFDGMVAASADSNADDEHDPEGATIAFERSQVTALARHAEEQVTEIDAALARLEAGTYGVCARCGAPIPAERLEARPTARTCVTC
jgi:RNA polymerase-binding protein DksA